MVLKAVVSAKEVSFLPLLLSVVTGLLIDACFLIIHEQFLSELSLTLIYTNLPFCVVVVSKTFMFATSKAC